MTQIKIFYKQTFDTSEDARMDVRARGVYPTSIKDLENEVNNFLAENEGKITLKDIKYTTQSMTDKDGVTHPDLIFWTVMVIYETL